MTQAVCHCEVLAIQNMSNGSRFHTGLFDTLLTSWPDCESGVGGLHVVAMTDSRIAALPSIHGPRFGDHFQSVHHRL